MSLATYSELKTSVANWLARTDLDTLIPDFISMGEERIYRDLRIRCMESALNSAISSGVIAIPSGYKAMKFAYIDGSPTQRLSRKDPEWIYQNYPNRASDSKPNFFAREGDNFIFGPYPDSGYTVKGVYYKNLDALSTSNETNWFTTNAPSLLLYAALCGAEPFLQNDPRLALWDSLYERAKDKIQKEDNSEELSGSILMTSRG